MQCMYACNVERLGKNIDRCVCVCRFLSDLTQYYLHLDDESQFMFLRSSKDIHESFLFAFCLLCNTFIFRLKCSYLSYEHEFECKPYILHGSQNPIFFTFYFGQCYIFLFLLLFSSLHLLSICCFPLALALPSLPLRIYFCNRYSTPIPQSFPSFSIFFPRAPFFILSSFQPAINCILGLLFFISFFCMNPSSRRAHLSLLKHKKNDAYTFNNKHTLEGHRRQCVYT